MTAPAHPVQAAATAHEQRVAGLVRWLAAADPREAPAVLRTHISTVILAGPLAYKLKRPVRLTFLDFSSLSQRRFFLEEELRINRRTAPQLYLDVLPVFGPAAQARIGRAAGPGEPGEPIDWLLRMRRFDNDGLLDRLAAVPALRWIAAGTATLQMFVASIANWMPSFFNRVYALPTDQAGVRTGVVMLVASVGVIAFGFIGDRVAHARPVRYVYLMSALALVTDLMSIAGTTNVGGRMIGTSMAFVTTNLVAPMISGDPTKILPVHLAKAAGYVGLGIALLALVVGMFLPEPKSEE